MLDLAERASVTGPARILEVRDGRALVRPDRPGAPSAWARLATPLAPVPGAEVLVTGDPGEELYVIGVLGGEAASSAVVTPEGARAEKGGDGRLRVLSPEGGLLFEYDPAARRARVFAPEGDLELLAERGNLTLGAGGEVRIGGRSLRLTALSSLTLAALGRIGSLLSLTGGSARLRAPDLAVRAGRGRLEVEDASLEGRRLKGRFGHARLTFERLETVAKTVVAKAGSVFRTVAGLAQLRAGRRRVIADGDYEMAAEKADLRSRKAFKVDGESVELG